MVTTTPTLWKGPTNVGGSADQSEPQIVATKDGGYIVVWVEPAGPVGDPTTIVVARKFDGEGNPLTGKQQVSTLANNELDPDDGQHSPVVTLLSNGDIAIAYTAPDCNAAPSAAS